MLLRFFAVVFCVAASACADGASSDGLTRRFTDSTGVPVVQHEAGAIETAEQLTLDSVPSVVYDAGADHDFDLTAVEIPMVLSDGRLVVASRRPTPRLLLFDASGAPVRVLARSGAGPGELEAVSDPLKFAGDTIVVVDENLERTTLVTADGGLVRTLPWAHRDCGTVRGTLPGNRLLYNMNCFGGIKMPAGFLPTEVAAASLDFAQLDTIAVVAGVEFVPTQVNTSGGMVPGTIMRRLGPMAVVAAWDSSIVTAPSNGGFTIEMRSLDGAVVRRVIVDRPRRPLTEAMWGAYIDQWVGTGPFAAGTRKIAIAEPRTDSLPAISDITAAPDGRLWIMETVFFSDTGWSAIAFRRDGEVAARITSKRVGFPVAFLADRVLVREDDADGVRRFAMYRMVKAR